MSKLLLLNNNINNEENLDYYCFLDETSIFNSLNDKNKPEQIFSPSSYYRTSSTSVVFSDLFFYQIKLKKGDKFYYNFNYYGGSSTGTYFKVILNNNEIYSVMGSGTTTKTAEGYYEIDTDLEEISIRFKLQLYSGRNTSYISINKLWINYDNYLASIQ